MDAPWKKLVAALAVLLVLAASFTLYTRPDFMVDVGNLMWSCIGVSPSR